MGVVIFLFLASLAGSTIGLTIPPRTDQTTSATTTVTEPTGAQETAAATPLLTYDTPQFPRTLELFCAMGMDGDMPDWEDESCRSYFRCDDLDPIVLSCPEGQMYSLVTHNCLESGEGWCDAQKRAIRMIMHVSSTVSQYIGAFGGAEENGYDNEDDIDDNSTYYGDNNEEEGAGDYSPLVIDSDTELDSVMRLARRIKRRAIDQLLKDTPTFTSQNRKAPIAIDLPRKVCEHLDYDTRTVEDLLNELLRTNSRCPGMTCNLPNVELFCPEDDDEENIDNAAATDDDDDDIAVASPKVVDDDIDDGGDDSTGDDNDKKESEEQVDENVDNRNTPRLF